MPYKIAIFASGSGTNAENITRHFADSDLARVSLVLTNVRDAGVVGRMQPLGVDTYFVPNAEWKENPARIADFLEAEGIDLVVLAGFMRKVDDEIVRRFRGRMLNIHPSLLPAYGGPGMYGHHVHEAVIAAGEVRSGVTVHQVSEVMDGGEIVAQESVTVLPEDTPETLEAKIHPVEYDLYPRAIELVLHAYAQQSAAQQVTTEPEEETSVTVEEEPQGSVADQWASALGVTYDEAEAERRRQEAEQVPPIPVTPPAYHGYGQVPPAPQQYPQQPLQPAEVPPMPSTYLLWSVLSLVFCCIPTGIVAIIFSCKVSSKYYKEDYEGAEKASRYAQIWIIITFCLGVLWFTFFSMLYSIIKDAIGLL